MPVAETLAKPDAAQTLVPLTHVGFLTILNEGNSYVGGYLVTNIWGRPIEFRLSSAVQPNKVQQILYANTLVPYICADLIGKTLIDKAGVPIQLVVTDRLEVLDLRLKLEIPVIWLAPSEGATSRPTSLTQPTPGPATPPEASCIRCHSSHPEDVDLTRAMLAHLNNPLDLAEPFTRIREAIAEARKMGVGK